MIDDDLALLIPAEIMVAFEQKQERHFIINLIEERLKKAGQYEAQSVQDTYDLYRQLIEESRAGA